MTALVNVETGELVEVSYSDIKQSIEKAKASLEEAAEQIVWQIERRAWTVLGYSDWNEMREAEYGGAAFMVPRAERPELLARMRHSGLTQQEIADTAGVSVQMIHNSVWRDLPDHLIDYLIGKGLRSQVTAYFHEQDQDGLPKRPSANPEGEHKQLELLSLSEFTFVHTSYLSRAKANRKQAEKIRLRCLDAHGVDLLAIKATA